MTGDRESRCGGFIGNELQIVLAFSAVICLLLGGGIASVLRLHLLVGAAIAMGLFVFLVAVFLLWAKLYS